MEIVFAAFSIQAFGYSNRAPEILCEHMSQYMFSSSSSVHTTVSVILGLLLISSWTSTAFAPIRSNHPTSSSSLPYSSEAEAPKNTRTTRTSRPTPFFSNPRTSLQTRRRFPPFTSSSSSSSTATVLQVALEDPSTISSSTTSSNNMGVERIEGSFKAAKERGEAAFVTFVTAGYPRAQGACFFLFLVDLANAIIFGRSAAPGFPIALSCHSLKQYLFFLNMTTFCFSPVSFSCLGGCSLRRQNICVITLCSPPCLSLLDSIDIQIIIIIMSLFLTNFYPHVPDAVYSRLFPYTQSISGHTIHFGSHNPFRVSSSCYHTSYRNHVHFIGHARRRCILD